MNRHLSRRGFLVSSAGGTAAAALLHAAATAQESATRGSAAGESAIPVVDTHEHLWDLSRLRLPWLNQPSAAHFRRSYLPKDYEDATSGIKIVKTVYMEVNCDPADHEAEADYVIKFCESPNSRMRGAVIGGSVADAGFPDYIKKYATNPYIKGVRMILNDPDRPKGLCLKPTFVKNVQYLGELGLSYDICIRPAELMDAVRLVEQCPRTRFIVDHCGNRDVQATDEKSRTTWEDGMKAAAASRECDVQDLRHRRHGETETRGNRPTSRRRSISASTRSAPTASFSAAIGPSARPLPRIDNGSTP